MTQEQIDNSNETAQAEGPLDGQEYNRAGTSTLYTAVHDADGVRVTPVDGGAAETVTDAAFRSEFTATGAAFATDDPDDPNAPLDENLDLMRPQCPPVTADPPHGNSDAKGIYKRPVTWREVTGWEFVTLDSEPNHRAVYERDGFTFMGYAVPGPAPQSPNPITGQVLRSDEAPPTGNPITGGVLHAPGVDPAGTAYPSDQPRTFKPHAPLP